MRGLGESVVIRRLESETTHVAVVQEAWSTHFIKDYWAPVGGAVAACGVKIPPHGVIMMTGTQTRCRACVHLTGITEQSPAIHEILSGREDEPQ